MSAVAPAARLRAHMRIPMFRDGYALVASGLITAAGGVPYWIVAAHRYSAADVGLNSAAISAMSLLAGVAQLNLSSALIRFVPVAGRTTRRLVAFSYLTSMVVAAVLAAVFLLVGRRLVPSLGFVDESAAIAFLFVGSTAAWCVFVLQDAALTGLRRAVWVPVENGAFSALKLVLLIAFASAFPRHGIFSSWAIAAVFTLVPIGVLIFGRLVPRHSAGPESPPSVGELARFVGPDYLGALGWLAAVTVVPLIVVERAGAAQNAYFALAWVIVIPLFMVPASMGSSLVASSATEPHLVSAHLRRMLRQTAMIVVPGVLVVEIGAPWLLGIFGAEYSANATTLLRLLALAAAAHVPIALAVNAARVRRRMRVVVVIQVAECVAVLGLTWVLLGRYGIDGAGWAWLAAEAVVAAGICVAAIPRERVGRARDAALGRYRAWRLRPVVADVLARVDPELAGGRLLAPTATDATVVAAGPVAVKVAHTDAGARSLMRELEVLRTLGADPRLEGWNALLPEVVASGRTRGHVYLVQRLVPGSDGRARDLAREACEAIGELHRLTARRRPVDQELLERWVDVPLQLLADAPGTDDVRARLHEAFRGLTLTTSWIHGDFVPGNVLGGDSGISGIVDWDRAAPDDLPALDVVQYVLAARLAAHGGELGELVTCFRPTRAEELLLGGLEVELDAAVLLCWLRHVASNLEKSARYGANRAWLAANVTAVLEAA